MELSLFDKYKIASELVNKVVLESDVIKKDMQLFFNPKNKSERALLFGAFAKYNHDKLKDAFIVCEKGFKHTGENKYKEIKYLIAITKNLK